MKRTLICSLAALAVATGAHAQQSSAPASSTQPSSQTGSKPQHSSATVPSADKDRPAAAATPNYQGAQGKKKDPGTACSTARLKKDGSLDCGMSGKSAAPKPSK
jgi:hypothetical protein